VNTGKLISKLVTAVLLAAIFGIAFYYRAEPPFDKVFAGDWIKFTSIDAYYHMRLIDNLVHNFPQLMQFDPYFIYPGGNAVAGAHFYDRVLAGIIWLLGGGNPSPALVDIVGVYSPVVLGALTVLPVYFIGRELFNKWAGLAAALLLVIFPSEFLGRSILGFTDHHAAESFLTAVILMFLIFALKAAAARGITFAQLRRGAVLRSPAVLYAVAAGIFLGMYFLTWAGALLFVFIIAVFFVIQIIVSHLRGQPSEHLAVVSVISLLVTLVIVLPFNFSSFYIIPLVVALLVPPLLAVLAGRLTAARQKPVLLPLITLGLGVLGGVIFWAVSPHLFGLMLEQFSLFAPISTSAVTTSEMQPFFKEAIPGYGFFSWPAWLNFSICLFLSGIGLIIFIIYAYRKQYRSEATLFLIWTLAMLLATASQRRFSYYLTVNVALLSGYFTALAYISIDGVIRRISGDPRFATAATVMRRIRIFAGMAPSAEEIPDGKPAKKRPESHLGRRIAAAVIATTIVFLLVFAPYMLGEGYFAKSLKTEALAGQARFAPSDGWCEGLTWLRDNSPEPFGDPDYYYQLYQAPPPGEDYPYPDTAYGVFSWWDYGYWISRIAHRIPYVNPSQDPVLINNTARFFIGQDPVAATEIVRGSGSDYIMIDYSLVDTEIGKFWAMAEWADGDISEYAEIYYRPTEQGGIEPIMLYYPEYYRSMVVRLYNFDGLAETPGTVNVISYDHRVSFEGAPYRLLTQAWEFATYAEAAGFLAEQTGGNYRIVGINPFLTVVPLEELTDYELLYGSPQGVYTDFVSDAPEVKIFHFKEE